MVLAVGLALSYRQMVRLTNCCVTVTIALGLGTAAFELVPHWFPIRSAW